MGLIGNGRARDEAAPMPHLIFKQQGERAVSRDLNEPPQRDGLSAILTRASQTRDSTDRLKKIVAGMTQEPRAAINQIEQEIGSLRDAMAMREQVLLEAIDQHANLSEEAVRGMGVLRQALAQIRDAFNAAMHPTPILDEQAEATSHPSNDRRA